MFNHITKKIMFFYVSVRWFVSMITRKPMNAKDFLCVFVGNPKQILNVLIKLNRQK